MHILAEIYIALCDLKNPRAKFYTPSVVHQHAVRCSWLANRTSFARENEDSIIRARNEFMDSVIGNEEDQVHT